MTFNTMTRVLITGGCGFIGHHIVQHFLKTTNWDIIIIDRLSYSSSGFSRLREINAITDPRVSVFTFDLSSRPDKCMIEEFGEIDYILHLAAETHVDNSIEDPEHTIRNNVLSTLYILEVARTIKNIKKFIYFSTDEVFGPAPGDTLYKEWDRHKPTNPYSASKSAGEMLCLSYENTYKVPVIICNSMNVFGERQHVEKFIPFCIKNITEGKVIPIHSYPGGEISGTRFYIHARNVAGAVLFIINNGNIGEKYNITGEKEVSNLDLAKLISNVIGKELKYEMMVFHEQRPGHDLRYGLDGSYLAELGWKPTIDFENSIRKTILWTLENKRWL